MCFLFVGVLLVKNLCSSDVTCCREKYWKHGLRARAVTKTEACFAAVFLFTLKADVIMSRATRFKMKKRKHEGRFTATKVDSMDAYFEQFQKGKLNGTIQKFTEVVEKLNAVFEGPYTLQEVALDRSKSDEKKREEMRKIVEPLMEYCSDILDSLERDDSASFCLKFKFETVDPLKETLKRLTEVYDILQDYALYSNKTEVSTERSQKSAKCS